MSGHSKWSQIKRKKGLKDRQKGDIFSKQSRLITLAVIEGEGITAPEHNVKLRLAVDKAKSYNLPKENIQRAIERGVGPDKNLLKELVYEAFGPKGAALVISVTTDNPNRALNEVRVVLDKHGAKLTQPGAVSYLFRKCALITFKKSADIDEKILGFADQIGAFDIEEKEEEYDIFFPFENIGHVKNIPSGLTVIQPVDVDYRPHTPITLDDEDLSQLIDLVGALENLDDVQKVYVNCQRGR